ncbi:MAG: DNA polymerase III subunit beta, partial [Bacillota bacterium]
EDLLMGIQTVGRAISVKNTLPVLSGILVIAENNLLTMRATDLDIAVECSVPADVAEDGIMVVADGRRFIEMVRQLPNEPINISLVNDFDINIKYSGAELTVRGFDHEQFPILPGMDGDIKGVMAGEAFAKMVRQVAVAASTEESRPVLTGIKMDISSEELVMVSTDSHRLALVKGSWKGETTESIIVPAKTMIEVAKIAALEENVSVIITKNNVCFNMGNTTFISRIINGQFPDYNPILPKEENFKYMIYVNKKTLLDALNRANLLSRDNNNIIKLNLESDGIMMHANSPEVGNIEEKIPATVVGDELLIGYNVKYIMDALKVIDSETVSLKLTGPLTPGIIVPEEEENYTYLLLPVRING